MIRGASGDLPLSPRQRRGLVLIVVLVTIAILSLSGYTFTVLMQTEEQAARLMTRRVQSRYLADSGTEYVRQFLVRSDEEAREVGGRWDNADQFHAIPVATAVNNLSEFGSFTVVCSNLDDDGNPEGFRYGLMDESSKLNINTLPFTDVQFPGTARTMLMALPDMTEDIADAIMDWLDADDQPRDYGVESDWYRSQSPAYEAKNGPLDSLDELLLIKGITPELLFGLDTNRNGILDDDEAASGNISSVDADMHLGWANYVTLYSSETNLNVDGLPRININADDLEQLYDDLKSTFDDRWADFIIQYRIASNVYTTADDPLETGDSVTAQPAEIDWDAGPTSQRKFQSVVDLIDARVVVEEDEEDVEDEAETAKSYLDSPMNFVNRGLTLPVAMSSLTHYEGNSIPGRINVMQAPRRVLNAIPFLTTDQIDRIIEVRENELDQPETVDIVRRHETWLWAELVVDLDTMKKLMPFVCAGGDVYRAEITGFFADGAGSSRAEVVFDTTQPKPRLLFWRDKSHLEAGYSMEVLGSQLISQ